MHDRKRSASLGKLPFFSFSFGQLDDGFDQPSGVFGRAQKKGSFFKCCVIFKRHYNHGVVLFSGYNDRRMIFADFFHCFCKILSGCGICYRIHWTPPVHVQQYVQHNFWDVNSIIDPTLLLTAHHRRTLRRYAKN